MAVGTHADQIFGRLCQPLSQNCKGNLVVDLDAGIAAVTFVLAGRNESALLALQPPALFPQRILLLPHRPTVAFVPEVQHALRLALEPLVLRVHRHLGAHLLGLDPQSRRPDDPETRRSLPSPEMAWPDIDPQSQPHGRPQDLLRCQVLPVVQNDVVVRRVSEPTFDCFVRHAARRLLNMLRRQPLEVLGDQPAARLQTCIFLFHRPHLFLYLYNSRVLICPTYNNVEVSRPLCSLSIHDIR